MTAASAHVQEPLQDRSRRTLEKIGRAVEELLATRSFDDISVGDIVRRARCSVGSFYARFASKDDLLPYLYERYDADLRPRILARAAPAQWEHLSFRETVALVVGHTVTCIWSAGICCARWPSSPARNPPRSARRRDPHAAQ